MSAHPRLKKRLGVVQDCRHDDGSVLSPLIVLRGDETDGDNASLKSPVGVRPRFDDHSLATIREKEK